MIVSRDINDRKLADQKLRESEENYRNMINNLDVGFYKGEFKGKLLKYLYGKREKEKRGKVLLLCR